MHPKVLPQDLPVHAGHQTRSYDMILKHLIFGTAAAALVIGSAAVAQSPQTPPQQEDIVVDQGVLRPLQIAVVNFNGPNGSELSLIHI